MVLCVCVCVSGSLDVFVFVFPGLCFWVIGCVCVCLEKNKKLKEITSQDTGFVFVFLGLWFLVLNFEILSLGWCSWKILLDFN